VLLYFKKRIFRSYSLFLATFAGQWLVSFDKLTVGDLLKLKVNFGTVDDFWATLTRQKLLVFETLMIGVLPKFKSEFWRLLTIIKQLYLNKKHLFQVAYQGVLLNFKNEIVKSFYNLQAASSGQKAAADRRFGVMAAGRMSLRLFCSLLCFSFGRTLSIWLKFSSSAFYH